MKKGFTMIELLVVLVLIGGLVALTVPAILNSSQKAKAEAYDSKIELIEKTAATYGDDHLKNVKDSNYYCSFHAEGDTYTSLTGYSTTPQGISYPCIVLSLQDLADDNYLEYDEDKDCSRDVIKEPTQNRAINGCNVYVYYKNKRVYAWFDKNSCYSSMQDLNTFCS